ncbi:MAG: cysteine desulfurase [Flaviaesturariibacter sp.]|nr:cysteine desulfurase [Flaviaesturariibacter sp.]
MLQKKRNGKQLIYFDSAASTQKPKVVMDKLYDFYLNEYAKPDERHAFSQETTEELENARKKMAGFLNAKSEKDIVFTRGCTEAINLVAGGFERGLLDKEDEVLISALEHHANIVPWQLACAQTGARLRVIPINQQGEIELAAYEVMLTKKVKIVAISHTSHALGNKLPITQMVAMAHKRGIPVLVDGAQAAPHMPVDMQELDCDFYTFSCHKMGSPSGVGVLYGKKKWLDKLPPYEGGGDMTKEVTFSSHKLAALPKKFEAGTMPFAEIISCSTLIDFLDDLGRTKTEEYEQQVLRYATGRLQALDRVRIHGTSGEKEPVLSFEVDGMDVKKLEGFLSDEYNIAVKAGDLSAQPLLKILGVKALIRASFAYYNTEEEVDIFTGAVEEFIRRKG